MNINNNEHQSINKNIKIVPEKSNPVEKHAWICENLEKNDNKNNPVEVFQIQPKSQMRTIKIFSINIDEVGNGFEATENEKLCANKIVNNCEVTITNEQNWPFRLICKERENMENQANGNFLAKKKIYFKPFIMLISECFPWNLPWILMTISFIQVSK